jgi:AsmA family protein
MRGIRFDLASQPQDLHVDPAWHNTVRGHNRTGVGHCDKRGAMATGLPARRWAWIAGISLAVLVLLALAAYAVLVLAFPPERLAAIAASEMRAASGRDFRIDGKLSIRLFPSIAVVANDVLLGNATWAARPDMVTVRRAAFDVALRPLLEGRLQILSIEMTDADVMLETDAHGRHNWTFDRREAPSPAPSPAGETASPLSIELERLLVSNARIVYREGQTGAARTVHVRSLELSALGDHTRVTASLGSERRPWRLDATTGRLEALIAGRADWPFDLRITTEGAALSAAGSLGSGQSARTLRAELSGRLDNADALAPLLTNRAAVPVPIDAKLSVSRTAHAVRADGVRITVAGQAVEGRATLHTGDTGPRLDAELAAASLDLSRWFGARSGADKPAATSAKPGPLFDDTRLPRIDLPPIPMQLALKVDRLILRDNATVSRLSAQVRSRPDGFTVEPLSLDLAGGTLNARLEVGVRGNDPPHLAVHVAAKGLSLDALDAMLGASRGFHGGRAALDASLTLAGNTPRKMAASTSGAVLVSVSDMALDGAASAIENNVIVSLAHALVPERSSSRDSLAIECAVVKLLFQRGVAMIDRSIAMETDQVAVSASGELNLVAQTVALRFRPIVKKGVGLSTANLAQLVKVEGPLRNPHVGVDLTGTTRQAASTGVAVATGGLSILANRLLRSPEDTRACQRALEKPRQAGDKPR